MLLRPNRIVFLFDEIAKRRPFEFSFGNRTPEGDSVLTDSGNLPIAAATRGIRTFTFAMRLGFFSRKEL